MKCYRQADSLFIYSARQIGPGRALLQLCQPRRCFQSVNHLLIETDDSISRVKRVQIIGKTQETLYKWWQFTAVISAREQRYFLSACLQCSSFATITNIQHILMSLKINKGYHRVGNVSCESVKPLLGPRSPWIWPSFEEGPACNTSCITLRPLIKFHREGHLYWLPNHKKRGALTRRTGPEEGWQS